LHRKSILKQLIYKEGWRDRLFETLATWWLMPRC
jgi:hypothetical protein